MGTPPDLTEMCENAPPPSASTARDGRVLTAIQQPQFSSDGFTFDGPRHPTTTDLGRAGEQFVAAHLLRLGYNAAPLPVDSGIDLFAHWTTPSGASTMALFQIKTTQCQRASFRLTEAQLRRLWNEHVNLVVVFWYAAATPFAVVVPPSLSYMLASGGFRDPGAPIRLRNGHADITVKSDRVGHAVMRNRMHDVSRMVNRFDRLEATDSDPFVIPEYASWAGASSTGLVVLES